MPIISLLTQFNRDYLREYAHLLQDKSLLSICSKDEIKDCDIEYTTDVDEIVDFIETNEKKVICVTYKSLVVLLEALEFSNESFIDLVCFDEAHCIVGDMVQDIIFPASCDGAETQETVESNSRLLDYCSRTLFLTATPRNENGIIMYREFEDEDDIDDIEEECHCGPLAYEYTHRQAVEDNVCRDFDIAINFYSEDTDKNVYKAIARCAFESGNQRILTFHSYTEKEHENLISVKKFVNDSENIYNNVIDVRETEFKDKPFKDFNLTSITATTKAKVEILEKFDSTPDDCVTILASCRSIGCGIDLKNANSVVFIDPKQSPHDIIQNIGRVCRNVDREVNAKRATVILPVFVDLNKYKDGKTDEDRNRVLQHEMSKHGDFRIILNVLSALQQNHPSYYLKSFQNPFTDISSTEINKPVNITSARSSRQLNLRFHLNPELEFAWKIDLANLTSQLTIGYLESLVIKDNFDEMVREVKLWIQNNGDIPKRTMEDKNEQRLAKWCSRQREFYRDNTLSVERIEKVETIPDWTWGRTIATIKKGFAERAIELENWVRFNQKLPGEGSKNSQERTLSNWCSMKRRNYFGKLLSQEEIQKLNSIPFWYWSKDGVFSKTIQELVIWLENQKRWPNKRSSDKTEKSFGYFVANMKHKKRVGKLNDNQIKQLHSIKGWKWEELDPFNEMYSKLQEWLTKYQTYPEHKSSDELEKKLYHWVSTKISEKARNLLSIDKIETLQRLPNWTWKEGSYKPRQTFDEIYDNLVKWTEIHKRIPRQTCDDKNEQFLGSFCSTKRKQHRQGKLSETRETLLSRINGWYWERVDDFQEMLEKVKAWVDKHGKLPSNKSKTNEEKTLGHWCNNKRSRYTHLNPTSIEAIETIPYWYWYATTQLEPPKDETKTLVTIRSKQGDFRSLLLQKYSKCVISGHSAKRSHAAHIVPYADCIPEEKYDINNGIILDASLHILMDANVLTIRSETCKVEIAPNQLKEDPDLIEYNGKFIEGLNAETREYLKRHNVLFDEALKS